MIQLPGEGWLEIIRFKDDIHADMAQAREAIRAHQERFDDFEREIQVMIERLHNEVRAQMQMIGRDTEDAKIAVQAHLGSHKMKDKEHLDRVQALEQERIKASASLRLQLLVVFGAVVVAIISGLFTILPHLIK